LNPAVDGPLEGTARETLGPRAGAVGARLTGDFMSYSVLVRQADGKLVEQCFDSKEAAEAATKGGMFAKPVSLAPKLATE
jgi:hypothetical protein